MAEIENAFTSYARKYDEDFTFSPIGVMQRKLVRKFLRKVLVPGQRILEVGCGTGEDAKWFTSQGLEVIATDLSPGMIEVACRKNDSMHVKFIPCDALQIAERFAAEKFDILFSNFGALNCLSPGQFSSWAGSVMRLLKPQGKIILVIMGRNCKWEQKYFLRAKEREVAFRRRRAEGVETIINGHAFNTYYYSPIELAHLFKRNFIVRKVRPIGYFIPPSYLNPYFRKHLPRLRFLSFLESFLAFPFLADKADHYYIEMQLK